MGLRDEVQKSYEKSPDPELQKLERDRNRTMLEEDIQYRHTNIAERRAIEEDLKKRHGPKWRQILGIGSNTDLATLKSFLGNSSSGLHKTASSFQPTGLRK